jgi:DNA polymerase III delta subunit
MSVIGYVHGDDVYGLDQAADGIAARAAGEDGAAPLRWRTSGTDADPATIGERVATATLFGGGTVAIVVDPAPLLRSSAGRAAMLGVIGAVAPGNGLVFVAPRDAGRARPSAGLEELRIAVVEAGGEVVEVHAPRPDRFPGWIGEQATGRGIDIAPEAARELASRVGGQVREGDIDRSRMSLAAIGELEKLALYAPRRRITVDDVRALVPTSTPASMWAFLDAVAERQRAKIASSLGEIVAATPEPVLVAALHRRLRDLVEVGDRLAAGETAASLVRSMRIKEYPARKMAAQVGRWRVDELVDALEGLGDLDARIKGDTGGSEAQRRLAFAIWIGDRVVPAGG